MSSKDNDLSRGKKEKSMLRQLIDDSGLKNYTRFAEFLGIDRNTLSQYRAGEREFRLTWEQIQKLEKLLDKTGKRFSDLPSDWIKDRDIGED